MPMGLAIVSPPPKAFSMLPVPLWEVPEFFHFERLPSQYLSPSARAWYKLFYDLLRLRFQESASIVQVLVGAI